MKFKDLGLIDNIIKVLDEQQYLEPTPIQEQAIPLILEGRDILGCAQTGTGKTAAFSLPVLQQLFENPINSSSPRNPRVLVVVPTRELANQIKDNVVVYSKYLKMKIASIIGGVKQNPQRIEIKKGVDFLIATPGRLLDLISQKIVNLKDVKYLVLDEADLMLDMGFINEIRKILKYITSPRQTMLFSATMPKEIKELAQNILSNPETIVVTPQVATMELINQYLYYVDQKNKKQLLLKILAENDNQSVLIFTKTKHGANKLAKELDQKGFRSLAIHGNKSQNARKMALNDFKKGKIKILVATDIMARGIDINELPFVINYDIPNEEETYVHRIGRTGRAGSNGISIAFCSESEVSFINGIERLINKKIEVVTDHPFVPDFYKNLLTKKPIQSNRNYGYSNHSFRKRH